MSKISSVVLAVALSACAVEPMADESPVITCEECGGGGGGQGTPVQLCHAAAAEMCDSIGYGGNSYCLLVFSADCSPVDTAAAQTYCLTHPEAPHDADCHLLWR